MKVIACIGDSMVFHQSLGVSPSDFWHYKLQKALRAQGCEVMCRNWGRSGWGTSQLMVAQANVLAYEVPDVALIMAGHNDFTQTIQVVASPVPTTTSCSVTPGKGVYLDVGCSFTINGQVRTVATRSTDAITWLVPLSGTPNTGDALTVNTAVNLQALGQYLVGKGAKVGFVGKPYQNFSTGSYDTVNAQDSVMAATRTAQKAAADALGVPYVDMYAWMKNLIVTGVDTQGSYSWHVFDQNTHHNAYGNQIIADATLAALTSSIPIMNVLKGV
jgi:lysophospholipase L1-like esterase